jgi:DNA repair exonuclease SbcCD ATPase subunit
MACKLIKKGVLGAALGAGLLALLFGTAAPSYVRTAFHKARQDAKDRVPIPFEIERARQQVADLTPAIRDNIENLARAEEDVQELREEIAATTENQAREKKVILALRDGLDSGDLRLAGTVSYTTDELRTELKRRFDHYCEVKKILAQKESTLQAKERAVVAAREMLRNIQAQRQALLTKIEEVEARHKAIEAAQTTNEFHFDDSALAQAKQTISELERRLNVMARTAELEGRFADQGLPVVVEPVGDVVQEVDAEFGRATDSGTKAAEKSL